jgi:lysophospholipase-3
MKHFVALFTPTHSRQMVNFASGNTLGVPFVDPLLVRGEKRTSKSKSLLLPNAKIFGERKLVMTPNAATYSAHEITQFLKNIGLSKGVYPRVQRGLSSMNQYFIINLIYTFFLKKYQD